MKRRAYLDYDGAGDLFGLVIEDENHQIRIFGLTGKEISQILFDLNKDYQELLKARQIRLGAGGR